MRRKILLYLIFGAICTLFNLGSQAIIKNILPDYQWLQMTFFSHTIAFWIQLTSGTILGFLMKFTLDKNFVFKDKGKKVKHVVKQFLKSSLMAVFITIIFWSTEILFHTFIHIKNSDLIGGLVGLSLGYVIKFFLDSYFVFPSHNKIKEKSADPVLKT